MAETAAPLLVPNRIDANRRNTRALLICFAALVLPAAWGVSQLLIGMLTIHAGGSVLHPLQLARTGPRGQVFGLYMAVVSTAAVLSITYLSSLFSTFILWRNGARRLGDQHPELRRIVEHLCIGAGLPPPTLYLTNSDAPNAFAIGFDPRNAKLVVSRGLLALLDSRELSGVVAHELSHIANRDTNLSTLLAAVGTAVRLPQTLFIGFVNVFRAIGPGGSIVILLFFGSTLLYILAVFVASVFALLLAPSANVQPSESFGQFMVTLLPMYVLVLAPAAAAFLRKKISYEREFLADADAALLTNDPEGLALALAKVSAAIGVSRERDPATAHMFFIDPAPPMKFSWLGGIFPTHPPPEERIALLTRMGDGNVEGLTAASDAGVNYRGELLLRQYAPRKDAAATAGAAGDRHAPSVPLAARRGRADVTGAVTPPSRTGWQVQLTKDDTPLYERADGWSAVVQTLSAGLVVTVVGFEGHFAQVRTEDSEGYIPSDAIAAPAAALPS